MLSRNAWICTLFTAAALTAACGQSESQSSGAPGTGHTGHEQPPGNENTDDVQVSYGGQLNPGPPAGGGSGGGMNGGSGGVPGSKDGGTLPPDECLSWQPSTVRAPIGDSNDTMSAPRAREALHLGLAPAPNQIRPRDFFNYYDIALSPTNADQAMTLVLELRSRAVPGQVDLFVGLAAPDVPAPRSVLTVVVDTTPSMAGVGLDRARRALEALGAALGPTDSVVVMTTDPQQGTLTPALDDPDAAMKSAAQWLKPSETGDVTEALGKAYDSARLRFDGAAQNRVLFLSDGAEPVDTLPLDLISAEADYGIRLVGIGTGPTLTYRERLLAKATHYGRGSYAYIDNETEAQNLFKNRFKKLLGVSFDDVRIELKIPSLYKVVDEPLTASEPGGGSETPQPLAPGATIATVIRLESCDASLAGAGNQAIEATVRWRDPPTGAEQSFSKTIPAKPLQVNEPLPELDKALAIRAYVAALESVDKLRVQAAIDAVKKAQATVLNQADPDLQEMLALLELHPVNAP